MASQPSRHTIVIGLLVMVALCLWIVLTRLQITYDLTFFLPAARNSEEQVLLSQFGQGPGADLLFIVFEDPPAQHIEEMIAAELIELDDVEDVYGTAPPTLAAIPPVIWDHRFLLADIDLTDLGIADALSQRMADLVLLADAESVARLARDPYLQSLDVLPNSATEDNARFLTLRTRVGAFDTRAQKQLIKAVQQELERHDVGAYQMLGSGAYGVDIQQRIQDESINRSILATIMIILVVGGVYRRLSAVVLGALPLVVGGLVGLAVLATIFGRTHGITLAFGFTLFGIVIDYPLHLLSHARHAPPSKHFWFTLRLGAISSALAYAIFAFGGSNGLWHLGVFATTGVLTAYLITRFCLPRLLNIPPPEFGSAAKPQTPLLVQWPWTVGLCLGAAVLLATAWHPAQLWQTDLSKLTPIDPTIIERDNAARQTLGVVDMRYLIAIDLPTQEAALQASEALTATLDEAVSQRTITGYRSPTHLLPSVQTQNSRSAYLADHQAGLAERMERIAVTQGWQRNTFAPFIDALQAQLQNDPRLSDASYANTAFASVIAGQLTHDASGWHAYTHLIGVSDLQALTAKLTQPNTTLIDLKRASNGLLDHYLSQILSLLTFAGVMVVAILALTLRQWRRVFWIVGSLAAAVCLTLGFSVWMLGPLSLFQLIATVLVTGLGLDYLLFFSRAVHPLERAPTLHALAVCVTTTVSVFALLATSSLPILADLGTTVTFGTLLCYLLGRGGNRYQA